MIPRSVLPCAAVVVALLAVPTAASADDGRHGGGHADAPSAPNVAAAPSTNPEGGGADAAAAPAVQVSPVPAGGADPAAVPATTPPARPAPSRHPHDDGDDSTEASNDGSGSHRGGPSVPGDAEEDDGATSGLDEPVVDPSLVVPVPSARRTVPGRVARLRTDGRAAIPRSAPQRVKQAIAAANQIVGRPYKWGGGHARLFDTGYDCSGAVGYALIRSGLLQGSMTSGMLARWAVSGDGRWISVYANRGHVYMEIAGLRLDTSGVGDPSGRSGVRWRPVIGRRIGFHARHVVGL